MLMPSYMNSLRAGKAVERILKSMLVIVACMRVPTCIDASCAMYPTEISSNRAYNSLFYTLAPSVAYGCKAVASIEIS